MAETSLPCAFGWKAVDAVLRGVDGKRHSVRGQMKRNGLVVAFICNHCPYVRAVIGRIVRDARDLKEIDVGFVAINSNDASRKPDDSFGNMQRFAHEHAFAFPYLHDADQSLARIYGAVCTPDFFGFNGAGELQYRGRLDASRKEEAEPGLRHDLYEAMRRIAETDIGPIEQPGSIGCSIKWRLSA